MKLAISNIAWKSEYDTEMYAFLKEQGILDALEEKGIQEGDTVRMYGNEFDYYK